MGRQKKKEYKNKNTDFEPKQIKNLKDRSKSIKNGSGSGSKSKSRARKSKKSKNKSLFNQSPREPSLIFEDVKIALTGLFKKFSEKEEFAGLLKKLGAKVTSAVSGVTDVLIHGYKLEDGREVNESKKYRIALEKGTLIYSEDDFIKEYEKKTGKVLIDNDKAENTYKEFEKGKIKICPFKKNIILNGKALPKKKKKKAGIPRNFIMIEKTTKDRITK